MNRYSENKFILGLLIFLSGYVVSWLTGIVACGLGLLSLFLAVPFAFYLEKVEPEKFGSRRPLYILFFAGVLTRVIFVLSWLFLLPYAPVTFLFSGYPPWIGLIGGPELCCIQEKAIDQKVDAQRDNHEFDYFNSNQPLLLNPDGILYSFSTDLDDDGGLIEYDVTNGVVSDGDILLNGKQDKES